MKLRLAAALLALSLPAAAAEGYFGPPPEREAPAVLKILQCTPGQSMLCSVRCAAPVDGHLPAAAACNVVKCICDDEPAKVDLTSTTAPSALVNFNLRSLLGLAQPK